MFTLFIYPQLRFEPRGDRKRLAPELIAETPIPPCAYVPMCKSTDTWLRVVRNLPNECRVFSTKERCPVLMSFEMMKETDNADVAEFLHSEFEYGSADRASSFDSEHLSEAQDVPAPLPPPPFDPSSPSPPAPAPEKKKSLFSGMQGSMQIMMQKSPFSSSSNTPSTFQARSPKATTSNRHNLWKDAAASESTDASDSKSSKSPGKKSGVNARVQKMLKEMPQVKMPKALSALKKEKKDPAKALDYKRVKIYKSCSNAGLDQTEISTKGIDGAKVYICGGEIWAEKAARLTAANGR